MLDLTDEQLIDCTGTALNRMLLGLVLGAGAFLAYTTFVGPETVREVGSLARSRSQSYVRSKLGIN